MDEELLPHIKYRISIDFGKVEMATSNSSRTCDLFGPTVNLCAKINSLAEPNGIAIGGRFLYNSKIIPYIGKNVPVQIFGEYSTGIKQI
ncbi:MAG: hypothetical protein WB501_04365 [Nitrososphaeraceae archaeon]|nr:hypothetical protein [Nitrososphaeraceae archaeon]MDW0209731.1 hypothetical protein [Nitrososphaeraceae archaeon]MDW0224014.1 hypothetical protein [Nitrososphaeraceae archaeon]MDW0277262.1 hypothetical protein [Nitrososphaeraceae archaeon]MDW0327948.1 hypothetical protein [Nitrososphaeraceae archaeon]